MTQQVLYLILLYNITTTWIDVEYKKQLSEVLMYCGINIGIVHSNAQMVLFSNL